MRHLINWTTFNEGIGITDWKLPDLIRCRTIDDEDFISIFRSKCKNFSFTNDLLWRSKLRKGGGDLQIFEPAPRRADPLAFPKFFSKIEDNPDYPVSRKKSLIGGTDPLTLNYLIELDLWLIIPFDNSKIVFCPTFDLWALDDERKIKSEKIAGVDVSSKNFIMKEYTPNFKVPLKELESLPKAMVGKGVEFFTSSPCLIVHQTKIPWLKSILK